MNTLVVLFALVSAACGSLVPLAQPPHLPAVLLDPHGRPLDTAEVIHARALHLQAKALEGHYAPAAHSVYAAPLAYPAYSPLLAHGHLLRKRSVGHLAYSAPLVAAPSAVSHQSRVDVISEPAVLSHAVSPVYAYAAPVLAVAPAAVSHQSRVDVRTSPAVMSHAVAAHSAYSPLAYSAYSPLAYSAYSPLAHSVYAPPLLAHSSLAHGHLLKKRSLGHIAYSSPIIAPSAVSHQSRVDVISEPAVLSHAVSPVYAHAVAPSAVSHQSRVDVRTSPAVSHSVVAPVAHSVYAAPVAYSSFWSSPLSHLAHAAHW